MDEPTLGARILDAAEEYANSAQAAIAAHGAGEWTHHHDEDTAEEHTKLRALCAQADAAERVSAGRIGDMAAGGELVKMADAMFAALDAYRARMEREVSNA